MKSANDDANQPEKDPRIWFESLDTEKRTAAIAIADAAFIHMFVDFASNVHTVDPCFSNHTPQRPHPFLDGDASFTTHQSQPGIRNRTFESIPLKKIVEVYNQYLNSDSNLSANDISDRAATPQPSSAFPAVSELPERRESENEEETSHYHLMEDDLSKESYPNTVASTAYIIPNASMEIEDINQCNEKMKNKVMDTTITTLHFKSGFELPVSNNSVTDKKIIASTKGRKDCESRRVLIKSKSSSTSNQNYDVHNHLNFSVLTPPVTHCGQNKSSISLDLTTNISKAQRNVVKSKIAASRALLQSSKLVNETIDLAFLENVRLIFGSAMKLVSQRNNTGKNNHVQEFPILTLDPNFLKEKPGSSLDFLQKVASFIGREQGVKYKCKSKVTGTCHFLNSSFPMKQCSSGTFPSWPQWFQSCVAKNNSVHIIVLLLARFELSIRESHSCYLQEFNEKDKQKTNRSCNENYRKQRSLENIKLESQKKIDLNTNGNGKIESEVEISITTEIPFLRLPTDKNEAILVKINKLLKFLTNMQEVKDPKKMLQEQIQDAFHLPNHLASLFSLKDLILVPLKHILTNFSDGPTTILKDMVRNIKIFSGKLNNIIVSCLPLIKEQLKYVNSTKKEKHSKVGLVDSGSTLYNLLLQDEQKSNSAKKRTKKKKRKKRKVAASNSVLNVNSNEKKAVCAKNTASTKELKENKNVDATSKNDKRHSPKSKFQISTTTSQHDEMKKSSCNTGNSNANESSADTNITVSRLNGINGTCVVGGGRVEEEQSNSDAWETVEPKGGRNGKSKKCSIVSNTRTIAEKMPPDTNVRIRNRRKTKLTSHRTTQRRIVKEIFISILDSVDVEINRKRRDAARLYANGQRRSNNDCQISCDNKVSSRAASLKDIVARSPCKNHGSVKLTSLQSLRNSTNSPEKLKYNTSSHRCNGSLESQITHNSRILNRGEKNVKRGREYDMKSKLKNSKSISVSSVDQNTVPTLQETLSGISAATQSSSIAYENDYQVLENECKVDNMTRIRKYTPRDGEVIGKYVPKDDVLLNSMQDDSSTSSGAANDQEVVCLSSSVKNPAPPLRTLLGISNTNSSSSSVASSLEAPHAIRQKSRRRDSYWKEDDVGCHLLNVCERLSADMNTFMGRRALALKRKRQERASLLATLQDSVQTIWAGCCHVEMYGSCATQLDLPSSDLDVVICGIDNGSEIGSSNQNCMNSKVNHLKKDSQHEKDFIVSNSNDEQVQSSSLQKPTPVDDQQCSSNSHQHSQHGGHYNQFYPPLSRNGSRLLRLSAELEQQSWAVQVKAIPTASVPVIKILADPSRLPGATAGVEWLMHQQHIAPAAATVPFVGSTPTVPFHTQPKEETEEDTSCQGKYFATGQQSGATGHHTPVVGINSQSPPRPYHVIPPWRGADVMNGLISLDITFEGQEHGGLGSTAYSAQIVQKACNETGLSPEDTPAVQVVLIIKELLAQRRLNEPFSGGLSSYAILLLVVAVMKERRTIRAEMERVEQQRMDVVAGTRTIPCQEESTIICKSQTLFPSSRDSSNDISKDEGTQNVWLSNKKYSSTLLGRINKAEGVDKKSDEKLQHKKSAVPGNDSGNQVNSLNVKSHEVSRSSWASIAKKVVNESQMMINPSESTSEQIIHSSKCTNEICLSHAETVEKIEEEEKLVEENTNQSSLDVNTSGLFPQGSNDVLEVLCSGEATAGKLLMHFMLFYGQHFDAQTTCVDVGGSHHPDNRRVKHNEKSKAYYPSPVNQLSPFIPKASGGYYDPITGIFTMDQIIVYDPLEGSQFNNVAKSCYAWKTIRCVFEQCYNTLCSAVERGANQDINEKKHISLRPKRSPIETNAQSGVSTQAERTDQQSHENEAILPLLELMLSF